jgi:hypothetical protein
VLDAVGVVLYYIFHTVRQQQLLPITTTVFVRSNDHGGWCYTLFTLALVYAPASCMLHAHAACACRSVRKNTRTHTHPHTHTTHSTYHGAYYNPHTHTQPTTTTQHTTHTHPFPHSHRTPHLHLNLTPITNNKQQTSNKQPTTIRISDRTTREITEIKINPGSVPYYTACCVMLAVSSISKANADCASDKPRDQPGKGKCLYNYTPNPKPL